jgi:AhpD family alkylhydroperoxidase
VHQVHRDRVGLIVLQDEPELPSRPPPTPAMSISPNALGGWAGLMESLSKTLDVKTRDGIALAVAETDGCDDCLAAHSYVSTNLAKSPRGDRAEPAGPFRRPEAAGCGGVREGRPRGARRDVRRPV